jgi:hypothetical protein
MGTFMTILSTLLVIAAIILMFRPAFTAAVAAYAAMWVLWLAGPADTLPPATAMAFWGVAALIVAALDVMIPRKVTSALPGRAHIAGASLAGAIAGMAIASSAIVLGAVTGAFLGMLAFSRTTAGRPARFPSGAFVRHLCALGLPAAVSSSMAAIVINRLLAAATA